MFMALFPDDLSFLRPKRLEQRRGRFRPQGKKKAVSFSPPTAFEFRKKKKSIHEQTGPRPVIKVVKVLLGLLAEHGG
jgi:hypothetical protein